MGSFHSSAHGTWTFDESSNVSVRPECTMIPWLPHAYGKTRPIVTSIGQGKYAGCLEYTPGDEQDRRYGILHGYPFTIEEVPEGISVKGFQPPANDPEGRDPPAVFHRL